MTLILISELFFRASSPLGGRPRPSKQAGPLTPSPKRRILNMTSGKQLLRSCGKTRKTRKTCESMVNTETQQTQTNTERRGNTGNIVTYGEHRKVREAIFYLVIVPGQWNFIQSISSKIELYLVIVLVDCIHQSSFQEIYISSSHRSSTIAFHVVIVHGLYFTQSFSW